MVVMRFLHELCYEFANVFVSLFGMEKALRVERCSGAQGRPCKDGESQTREPLEMANSVFRQNVLQNCRKSFGIACNWARLVFLRPWIKGRFVIIHQCFCGPYEPLWKLIHASIVCCHADNPGIEFRDHLQP